jgi:glyoxylase-like metal-dependent hydrolase (beta-lactamase superfamily II)/rhodanese-related sulfurtransferase
MKIHQFIDSSLAHFSYAIVSEGEIALIDPGRDPRPYYEYAEREGAWITAIFETHPHADFVSSHTEIARATGAKIYESRLVYPEYEFTGFDNGDIVTLGNVTLRAMNTPGHSPDSICILAEIDGLAKAVFTGDTLMIGDVGRPDLREDGRNQETDRRVLARAMYYSIHDLLLRLPADVKVYPAHGGGSLCSRSQESATFSTIGNEMMSNPSLRKMSEDEFVNYLLSDQLFVPKYFKKDVSLNKKGAMSFEKAVNNVPYLTSPNFIPAGSLVVDTRKKTLFNKGHLAGAINLRDGAKFETWLGSIIGPKESFYLVAEDLKSARVLIEKAAKIGYESNMQGTWAGDVPAQETVQELQLDGLVLSPDKYTVLDVRNTEEARLTEAFEFSINIPLPELRERWREVPTNKPIIVHCASGYRSTAAASILRSYISNVPVYDLEENVKFFMKPRRNIEI